MSKGSWEERLNTTFYFKFPQKLILKNHDQLSFLPVLINIIFRIKQGSSQKSTVISTPTSRQKIVAENYLIFLSL